MLSKSIIYGHSRTCPSYNRDATAQSFEKAFRALTIYRQEYGHLIVPAGYTVPADNRHPLDLHGFELGEKVIEYRQKNNDQSLTISQKSRLDGLGFAWGAPLFRETGSLTLEKDDDYYDDDGHDDDNDNDDDLKSDDVERRGKRDNRGFDQIIRALSAYKTIYGNVAVPSRFVVPEDARFPRDCYNLYLGRRLSSIRRGQVAYALSVERREKLEALGVTWHRMRDSRKFPHVYQALILYKQLYGHLNIPRSWIIPEGETMVNTWPVLLQGMKLGRTLYDIRRKAAYTKKYYQDLLIPLGVFNFVQYDYLDDI